jgi:hypothetical protein
MIQVFCFDKQRRFDKPCAPAESDGPGIVREIRSWFLAPPPLFSRAINSPDIEG